MKQTLRLLTLSLLTCTSYSATHFYIVVASFRNAPWCIENLESVLKQTYTAWDMYITVDGCGQEDDGTALLLKEYIYAHHLTDKITIQCNYARHYALANIYHAIVKCPDDDWVVVILDGDDMLYDEHTLERVALEYDEHDAWLTYGQFISWPYNEHGSCEPFPAGIIKNNNFRTHPWVSSHLRTFYAWLFKLIKPKDLIYNRTFFKVAGDVAIMFPMLEMASQGHISFIPDYTYIYRVHPSNDCALRAREVIDATNYLRNKQKYAPLCYRPTAAKKKIDVQQANQLNDIAIKRHSPKKYY